MAARARRLPAHPVLAADTSVILDGQIIGKPADRAEAESILARLAGRSHEVLTAVAVGFEERLEVMLSTSTVEFAPLDTRRIRQYVASGESHDKAGAYAIQNADFDPVAGLTGCYANVMGLPLCHLTTQLRRLGLYPPVDVPGACRAATGYACTVHDAILDPQALPCRHELPPGLRAGENR